MSAAAKPGGDDLASRLMAELRDRLAGDEVDRDAALATLARLEPLVALLRSSTVHSFDQFEARVAELSLVRRAGELFSKVFDLRELGKALVELVAESIHCRHASLHLIEPEGARPLPPICCGESLGASATATLPSHLDAALFESNVQAVELAEGEQALLCPLESRQQKFGVLVVAGIDASPDRGEDARRTLEALADLVAVAIRHARLVEEHMQHLQDLETIVARRTREVNEARAALSRQQRVAAMGKLAASIAHEVNNPMSFLISNLARAREFASELGETLPEVLSALDAARELPSLDDERVKQVRSVAERVSGRARMALLPEELGAIVADAEDGAERIRRVGEDLRRFAQGVAGAAEPVDLNRLVETALHIARSEAKHGVGFECRFEVLPEVPCQRYQVTQVLINLLQNGVEAVSDGGTVRVVTRLVDRFVEVEVSDDGPGISGTELSSIFEPFYTTKADSSGLGLSIARDIASGHGGSLEAQSSEEGACFRLRLPVSARPTAGP